MVGKLDFTNSPPKMGAVIRGKAPVSSLSFHGDGVHLFVASAEDAKLRLVDCHKGASEQPAVRMETDGVRVVAATHHNYSVLTAGSAGNANTNSHSNYNSHSNSNHNINYLSLYDNKLLRTFKGHYSDIMGLSMSPVDDTFLSSSRDRTVRLWNLQQAGCLAKLELPPTVEGTPRTAYDSTGLVFGVTAAMAAGSGHLIHLYDARKYSGGAFAELKLNQSTIEKSMHNKGFAPEASLELSKAEWTSMQFNTQGNKLLVTAKKGVGLLLDGFDGSVSEVFVGEPLSGDVAPTEPLSACFTTDDRTVLGGCEDGTVCCWDANNGRLTHRLEGHCDRVGAVACNPKLALVASACTNTALWTWS